MSSAFDVSVASPASVEQVHAAFGGQDYWLARFAAFGADSTLDTLTVDADGTVRVGITQHLGRQLLPGMIANLAPGDLRILHDETWQRVGDEVRGTVSVAAPAALGSGSGVAVLAPSGTGSRLDFTATVDFRVPLVGRKIERHIARQFAEGIPEIQNFTTSWIAEHG